MRSHFWNNNNKCGFYVTWKSDLLFKLLVRAFIRVEIEEDIFDLMELCRQMLRVSDCIFEWIVYGQRWVNLCKCGRESGRINCVLTSIFYSNLENFALMLMVYNKNISFRSISYFSFKFWLGDPNVFSCY